MITTYKTYFFLLSLVMLNLGVNSAVIAEGNDAKFRNSVRKGDVAFDILHYEKAIEAYEKALTFKKSSGVKVKIAECYSRLNQPKNAREWYESAMTDTTILKNRDMLKYAQVMVKESKYEEALKVFKEYGHSEKWVQDRIKWLENSDRFYRNTEAFEIEEAKFNTKYRDYSPEFLEDGVVFTSDRPSAGFMKPKMDWGTHYSDIFFVNESENSSPIKLGKGINSKLNEGPTTFFDGNQKMLLTRNDKTSSFFKGDKEAEHKLRLYMSQRKENGKWNTPVKVPFDKDEFNYGHPTINSDGNLIYFASDMPGGYGGVDLYKVSYEEGIWGTPINLGDHINTEDDEVFPFLHNDTTLYYSSEHSYGLGGLDIYKVDLTTDQIPRNLGTPLNSPFDDFGIILRKGSSEGYFSSNREGGTGSDDIYKFVLYEYLVEVELVDKNTGQPIKGNLDVREYVHKNNKEHTISTVDGSKVAFKALRGSKFEVAGFSEFYDVDTLEIETADQPRFLNNLKYKLELSPSGTQPYTSQAEEVAYDYYEEPTPIEHIISEVPIVYNEAPPIQNYEERSPDINYYSPPPIVASQDPDPYPQYDNSDYSAGDAEITVVNNNGVNSQILWKDYHSYNESTDMSVDDVRHYVNQSGGRITGENQLNNIHYQTGSARITPTASRELNKIAQYLLERPDMRIVLSAHTDVTGDEKLNDILSRKRAENAEKYLLSKDVSRRQIITESFGEQQVFLPCGSEDSCPESTHKVNRRTDLRLIPPKY